MGNSPSVRINQELGKPCASLLLIYQLLFQKNPLLVGSHPRSPQLFQEPDEIFQITVRQMAHQLAVQGEQWLVEVVEDLGSLVRQRHIDDPAIFLATQPIDEARLLQPVNQA